MAVENIHETLNGLIVNISELKQRKKNARRGDVSLIKESLEVNGQYRPIVVNKKTGEVLAGNHTLRAAKLLGWEKIAATYVEADEDQAARIVLIDNRANDVADYDDLLLSALLKEFGDLAGTGYTEKDLNELLQSLGSEATHEGQTDPDDIPEEPETAITQTGDVWLMGEHRLVCGDSTDQTVIARLMDGATAQLLLTDPPYGVDYSTKAKSLNEYKRGLVNKHKSTDNGVTNEKPISADDLQGAALEDFLIASLGRAAEVLEAGAPVYLFHADWHRPIFQRALSAVGMPMRQNLIWVKQHFAFSRQDYHWRHEPILYGWKEGAAHNWYGGFDKDTVLDETEDISGLTKDELVKLVEFLRAEIETTVIYEDKPHASKLHPTTKPVALLERLIYNSSEYKDIILDIFGGSGSTLIAADRIGRTAYLAELDPVYCDVIVRRWEEHTGKTAHHLPGGKK